MVRCVPAKGPAPRVRFPCRSYYGGTGERGVSAVTHQRKSTGGAVVVGDCRGHHRQPRGLGDGKGQRPHTPGAWMAGGLSPRREVARGGQRPGAIVRTAGDQVT